MISFQEAFHSYNKSPEDKCKIIFSGIFTFQNRLQTACEKIQTELTIKQWLLLAIVSNTPEPQNLTNIGRIMGCSRQNIKKLALSLEEKSYINFIKGENNSLYIVLTEKFEKYSDQLAFRHSETLRLLFSKFNSKEINELFNLFYKLFLGLDEVEKFSEEL